jgi:hypothetical protein
VTVGVGDSGGDEWVVAACAAARGAIERAQAAEPAITVAVQGIVEDNGATLERLDRRIKTEDSLTDKIRAGMHSDDAESVAREMVDILRYTAKLPDEEYWRAGSQLCEALAVAGHRHVGQSTGWTSVGYRGRNERFESPDGYRFELQIHTEASLSATEETHPWYEEQRRLDTPPERRFELQQMQNNVFNQVPIPPGTPSASLNT